MEQLNKTSEPVQPEKERKSKTRSEKIDELHAFDDETDKHSDVELIEADGKAREMLRDADRKLVNTEKQYGKDSEQYQIAQFDLQNIERKMKMLADVWAEKSGANREGATIDEGLQRGKSEERLDKTNVYLEELRQLNEYKEECSKMSKDQLLKEIAYNESRVRDALPKNDRNSAAKYSTAYNARKFNLYMLQQYLRIAKEAL